VQGLYPARASEELLLARDGGEPGDAEQVSHCDLLSLDDVNAGSVEAQAARVNVR